MHGDMEEMVFKRELSQLYREYETCTDISVKEKILQDIELLKQALELLLLYKTSLNPIQVL